MVTTEKLTLARFLALPETKPGTEYIAGEVCQKTMPTTAHIVIQRLLSFVFTVFLREHPVGEAGPEWRCVFGPPGSERAPLPDFAFVATEHLGADQWDGPHYGPPDLAVEILSPDDRATTVLDKIAFYLAHGVRLVWLIDPKLRTVSVHTPDAPVRWLTDEDTLDGGAVVPGFRVTVREILPPSGPLTPAV